MPPDKTIAVPPMPPFSAVASPSEIWARGYQTGHADAVNALQSDEVLTAAAFELRNAMGYDGADSEFDTRVVARALVDALTGEQGPGLCERVLVGRGTDTWDPLCGRLKGHEGPCE